MRPLNVKDFLKEKKIQPLGVGHFGKVWLVKYDPSVQNSQINDANKAARQAY